MPNLPNNIVLVTGGAGFIGSNVVKRLASRGVHDIVVCDEFQHPSSWRYLEPHVLHDTLRPHELTEWLGRHGDHVRAIVHMGAISATTETDLNRIIQNNVRLSLDLWEFATWHDPVFIYASSAATYGDGTGGFVDDDSLPALAQLHPLNPYGWSKHLVDRRFLTDLQRGRPAPTRWAGLKFFNVYGPNEGHKGSMRSVVHQMYPAAKAGEPVRLFKSDHPDYPDGGQLRDFVSVEDCCDVIERMLDAPELRGLYNVGTGTARSFADLAGALFNALGQPRAIEYIDMPAALRGKYQYFTQADVTKVTQAGFIDGFRSLEAGVAEYVEHLRVELG